MISEAVKEFCAQCQLTETALDEEGKLALEIEEMGMVQFVMRRNLLLLALGRGIEHEYLLDAQAILEHCHYSQRNDFPLHAQLSGKSGALTLGLSYVLPGEKVTAATIDQALTSLGQKMDEIFTEL